MKDQSGANGDGPGNLKEDHLSKPPLTPCSAPTGTEFTSDHVGNMGSNDRKDEDLSLIVHVDDTQNDLDNDILGSQKGDESTESCVVGENNSNGNEVDVSEKSSSSGGTRYSKDGDKAKRLVHHVSEGNVALFQGYSGKILNEAVYILSDVATQTMKK